MNPNKISTSFINERLSYNIESGNFTWKKNGKLAGGIHKSTGYVRIKIDGVYYKAHRLAWQIVNGHTDLQIDHKDGDRANNKINNLRIVRNAENARNQGLHSRNRSGFCGVRWINSKSRWISEATVDGKSIRIGTFRTIVDAVASRIRFNRSNGFHENHGKRSGWSGNAKS